jgi:hypothetical protein
MVLRARTASRENTVTVGMIPTPEKLEAHVPAPIPSTDCPVPADLLDPRGRH